MRKYAIKTLFCCVVLFIFFGNIFVYAINDKFETTEISQEEINRIWQYLDIRVDSDPHELQDFSDSIVSFDISAQGDAVIALKERKIIVVDADGNLLNCYKFSCDGSYCIRWNGDIIELYLVRGSSIVSFSLDGQLINIVKASDNNIQNNSLWNQLIYNTTVTVGDSVYAVKNNMKFLSLLSSYSQLVKTDGQGNTTTIYDVSALYNMRVILICTFIIVFLTIVAFILIKPLIQVKHQ